ncbi:MAG: MFS transporter, partial [Bacteroidota bacterium]
MGIFKKLRDFGAPARSLILAEFSERASYYGYRVILQSFLTTAVVALGINVLSQTEAAAVVRGNIALAYVVPLFAGLLADWYLNRYRTLLLFSVVCTLGHLIMSLAFHYQAMGLETGFPVFNFGLMLVAVGAGGIKPNASGLFGDTLAEDQQEDGFKIYYLAFNTSALLLFALNPWVAEHFSYEIAFGLPAILMIASTLTIMWYGKQLPRNKPTGYPKNNWLTLNLKALALRIRGTKTPWEQLHLSYPKATETTLQIGRFGYYFLFFAVLWWAFDCQAAEFKEEIKHMDTNVFGLALNADQFETFNTLFVIMMVPIILGVIGWLRSRGIRFELRYQVLVGMGLLALSMLGQAWIANTIASQADTGLPALSGYYSVVNIFVLTCGEVLFSIG